MDGLEAQSGEAQADKEQADENKRLSELVAGMLHVLAMSRPELCQAEGLDYQDFSRWICCRRANVQRLPRDKVGPLNARLREWLAHQTRSPTPMVWRKNAWKPQ